MSQGKLIVISGASGVGKGTVLKLMMENQQIVLSRDTFLTKVWGYDYMGETNVVDVYIRYLRSTIDDAFGVDLIHTVRGVGYVIREE